MTNITDPSFQDRLDEMLKEAFSNITVEPHENLNIAVARKVKPLVAQLFKDYIEAQQPDGMSEDLIRIAMNGKPHDAHAEWTPQESAQLSKAWNQALQQYKSNLLGGLDGTE